MKKLFIALLLIFSSMNTIQAHWTANDVAEGGIGVVIGSGISALLSAPIFALLQYAKDGTTFSENKSQNLAFIGIVGVVTAIGVLFKSYHTTTTQSNSDSNSHKTQTQHGNNLFNAGMAIGAILAAAYAKSVK